LHLFSEEIKAVVKLHQEQQATATSSLIMSAEKNRRDSNNKRDVEIIDSASKLAFSKNLPF